MHWNVLTDTALNTIFVSVFSTNPILAVPHMPLQQQPHDRVCAAHAANLLVVTERNQQRAARTEIGARSQRLSGKLQKCMWSNMFLLRPEGTIVTAPVEEKVGRNVYYHMHSLQTRREEHSFPEANTYYQACAWGSQEIKSKAQLMTFWQLNIKVS
jgi:hypothetical protein